MGPVGGAAGELPSTTYLDVVGPVNNYLRAENIFFAYIIREMKESNIDTRRVDILTKVALTVRRDEGSSFAVPESHADAARLVADNSDGTFSFDGATFSW